MKIRRIMIVLLLAALLLGAVPARAAEEDMLIGSVEDLFQLGMYPTASFRLTADLDMQGVEWEPVAFRGVLNGDGHTIYNLRVTDVGYTRADTVDGNDKVYDSVFAGLFSVLTGAQVRNLTLQGVDIDVTSDKDCFVGGFAGYVKNAQFINCSLLDARLNLTAACPAEEGRDRCNAGVGGIAGFGTCTVSNCQVVVTMVFRDECDASIKSEQFMGGVLSNGNVGISDTVVKLRGYDSCRGYVHNGGLVGMFYLYDKREEPLPIVRTSVEGAITFYEDNADRRAYCEAFIGERLSYNNLDFNTCQPSFIRDEVFDYTAVLSPEKCSEPHIVDEVTSFSCSEIGYTTHTCTVCGNTWRDSFTLGAHTPGEWVVIREATTEESGLKAQSCSVCGQVIAQEEIPPHVPGDWVVVRDPGYGTTGLRQILCRDCGAVLEEEEMAALIPVSNILLEPAVISLRENETGKLTWSLAPADAHNPVVRFTSSDPSVATADTDGTVHALSEGTAVIRCTSADGFASAECTVTVKYSVKQWIIQYILFGWIWNR
ncbi:MAG: Ig-like domain-containing protein [Oscillospiraceae bacterium]|nr:Ig-like domain-containing protein [Oscillospiraceae bacterium]